MNTNAVELGKIGGLSRSAAKKLASKANGSLGGRPIKTVTINDDGASIAGCNYVYAPKGQAGEYSALACNPYRGCGHECKYCYVPNVIRMKRELFDSSANVRVGFQKGLLRDCKKYKLAGISEQVMLSFTSDPYHPFNTSETTKTINTLHDHGLGICCLTKGGTRSLRDIDLLNPKTDAFASTLTSMNNSFSNKWERGAADATDRVDALKSHHDKGIFTWVSLEPTIDIHESLRIIEETHEFVDLFKVGRANYMAITKTTDWEYYTHKVIDLMAKLNQKHYIKKDLQCYLPEGYYNPLRIAQHN